MENFIHCPKCKVYLRVGEILEVHFSDGIVKYGLVVSESEPRDDAPVLTIQFC